jgi:hypothetical protein
MSQSYVSTFLPCSVLRGWDLDKSLDRLRANVEVQTVLGSMSASSDTVEFEGRQMKQFWIKHWVFSRSPQSYFFKISSLTADSDLVLKLRDNEASLFRTNKDWNSEFSRTSVRRSIVGLLLISPPSMNLPAALITNTLSITITVRKIGYFFIWLKVFLPIVKNPVGIN